MLTRNNTLWSELAQVMDSQSHILWRNERARAASESEWDRLFRWSFSNGVSGHYPPVNVTESEDGYTVQARVPGLTKDDISIQLEGRELRISGDHKRVEAGYGRQERASGRFERALEFRHAVQADKIEATVKDGILTVRLPKSEEAKPRKIAIAAQ